MVEGKGWALFIVFKGVHSPLNCNKIPFVWNNSIQIIATLINVLTAFWDHLVVSHPSMLFGAACEKCPVKGIWWIKIGNTATLTGRPTFTSLSGAQFLDCLVVSHPSTLSGVIVSLFQASSVTFYGKRETGISNTSTHHPRLLGSIG